jgi:hypothetical protein
LINIKRLAYETVPPPLASFSAGEIPAGPSPAEIEQAVRKVINEILQTNGREVMSPSSAHHS